MTLGVLFIVELTVMKPTRSDGHDMRQFQEDGKMKLALALLRDEQGATAVEYGLIVAAIAGLIIAVVFTLGNKVANAFNTVQSALP